MDTHPSSPQRKIGRRYIGIVFDRDDQLPAQWDAQTQRRLDKVDLTRYFDRVVTPEEYRD